MRYCIIGLNVILGTIITSAFYPIIGICVLIFSLIMIIFGCNNAIGSFFVTTELKSWGSQVNNWMLKDKRLLISIACLSVSLKIGAGVALFVETGAIVLLAFCILLAFGYFFEGSASGMNIGLSFSIARLVVKLFLFLSISFDRIAGWIAKLELYILNVNN